MQRLSEGQVRSADQDGNDQAEFAADLGRRGASAHVSDVRRLLTEAWRYWFPVLCRSASVHNRSLQIGGLSRCWRRLEKTRVSDSGPSPLKSLNSFVGASQAQRHTIR